MTYIIGQLTERVGMRTAKTAKDKAQYKREFRSKAGKRNLKARNKVEFIKKNQKEKA